MGASFLLLWACEAAQADVSQALALSAVALIAVLPEYAVDMYFTWEAGKFPESDYAHYAIANMTGANRLLIGVAWALIALIFWIRYRKDVILPKDRRTELFFLGLATVYAFIVALKNTLTWIDGLVFLGIYGWYMYIAARRGVTECEIEGPAELVFRRPARQRRILTASLFLFAALVILANAEPFSEGLVATGKLWGINEFLLVQWLAPIASEAPEFIVALGFAWRGMAGMALGSLLCAKLNQWTLLVGMIPGVFALSHGTLEHPMPMSNFQMSEILLTAAQSFFAVALLAPLRLSISGAVMLFALFSGQLIVPYIIPLLPPGMVEFTASQIHPVFTLLYIGAGFSLVSYFPLPFYELRKGCDTAVCECGPVETLTAGTDPDNPFDNYRSPHCSTCKWRLAAQEARAQARLKTDK